VLLVSRPSPQNDGDVAHKMMWPVFFWLADPSIDVVGIPVLHRWAGRKRSKSIE
jgi:hypothetical protein